jgi:hypothetical protein
VSGDFAFALGHALISNEGLITGQYDYGGALNFFNRHLKEMYGR